MTRRSSSERRAESRQPEVERRKQERRQVEDRRAFVRTPLDLWMEEIRGNELYFRRVGNLSEGGVMFEQSIPHPVGTKVKLRFELAGESGPFETEAEVVQTPDVKGVGMGLRFVDLPEDVRKRIETFIKKAPA